MTLKSLFRGKFLREWVGAITLASVIAYGTAAFFIFFMEVSFEMEWSFPITLVSFVTSFVLLQFLVIRKRITHAKYWMLSGVLSIIAGLITFVIFLPEITSLENSFAFCTVILVSVISPLLVQWLILDQQFYRSWLWILNNIVGLIAATYIADIIVRTAWGWQPFIDVFTQFLTGLSTSALFGIVFGSITGIGLRIFFMKYRKT